MDKEKLEKEIRQLKSDLDHHKTYLCDVTYEVIKQAIIIREEKLKLTK